MRSNNISIQVVFSIADIDTPQEPELAEEEEGAEETGVSYPVRCSITVSKVRGPAIYTNEDVKLTLTLTFAGAAQLYRRCHLHRHPCARGCLCDRKHCLLPRRVTRD